MQANPVTQYRHWQRRFRLGLPEILRRLRYRVRRFISSDASQVDYLEWVRRFESFADGATDSGCPGWFQLELPSEPVQAWAGLPTLAWDPSAPGAMDKLPATMTHGVFLAPGVAAHAHAPGWLKAAMTGPGIHLAFGDEDTLDASGVRRGPYFKPEWDPELLLEQDYVAGLFVVSRSALEQALSRPLPASGMRHALLLRLARILAKEAVARIPRILSHRAQGVVDRSLPLAALEDWISGDGAQSHAVVEAGPAGHRIQWRLPADAPMVSVVIPTRDQPQHLRRCLESLSSTPGTCPLEIVLVDNGTRDAEALRILEAAARHGAQVLRRDEPFNFSRLVNAGVQASNGDLVCLLNNDIQAISPGWVDRLAALAMRPEVGAVGALLTYPDGSIQHAGILCGLGGAAANLHSGEPAGTAGQQGRARCRQQFMAVTAACMMLRRSLFLDVGGFDIGYPVAFNDVDFCLRLRQTGRRIVWTPDVVLRHHESASRGADDTDARRSRMCTEFDRLRSRWADQLDDDPAYNPNLTLHGKAFQLTLVPRWVQAHDAPAPRQETWT